VGAADATAHVRRTVCGHSEPRQSGEVLPRRRAREGVTLPRSIDFGVDLPTLLPSNWRCRHPTSRENVILQNTTGEARVYPPPAAQPRMARQAERVDLSSAPLPPLSGEMANAWQPYAETCIENFGANRCMFESNFPIDKGACSYSMLFNACKRLASGASGSEKADLFSATASRGSRRADRGWPHG
jgi:amidohydrolase family protein